MTFKYEVNHLSQLSLKRYNKAIVSSIYLNYILKLERYWHGYLSGVRCKWPAYGPAHATATPPSLAAVKSDWFTFLVPAYPGCPGKRPLNGCSVHTEP